MPTYCYKTKDGQRFERVFRMGEAPESIEVGTSPQGAGLGDGEDAGKQGAGLKTVVAYRDYGSEFKGVPPTKGWPLECIASGVNANQAGKLRQFLADKGVPTEVSSDGNPIYRDSHHRKKALAARGLHDKSSFC